MENINAFLDALIKLGVPKHETFQTVDLYEGKNVVQVIDCIFAFSRHAVASGFQGPLLGPKLAEKRVRYAEYVKPHSDPTYNLGTENVIHRRAIKSKQINLNFADFRQYRGRKSDWYGFWGST
jgi:hypothetical protein